MGSIFGFGGEGSGAAGVGDSVVDGFFFGDGEGVIITTDDESLSDGESGVGAGDGAVAGDAT
ncbi:hypothetical protein AGMMS49990_07760 [Endomicrobiia bacterium]|nr:hypothetical protein AGMMS49990_07760 [Endomicrobiia bacterium]